MANRIRPREGWRALQALIQNPDDTEQAFRVIGAFAGNASQRMFARFRRDPQGARLLAERPTLAALLGDPVRLHAMPEGSLGRAMIDFYEREQISPQGLAEASIDASDGAALRAIPEDQAWMMVRLRDQHDLYHVLTGYGRDVRGELAVLAFTAVQMRNPGIAVIPLYLLLRAGFRSELGRLIRHGLRRGLKARWLAVQPWESLFERPLDEVREGLRLGAPPRYEAVRSSGAPPIEQPA